jgi:MoxR-like ATPase
MKNQLLHHSPSNGFYCSRLPSGGHVLLEDYPGLAKTLIANSFATALGLDFKRIQFTPDLLPGDITGGYIFDRVTSQLRAAPGAHLCQHHPGR